jgi:hypothetical protein
MSAPMDAELASLLDMGELASVLELAARQITGLHKQAAQDRERLCDLSARVAMLEAILPATLPPF